MALRLGRAGDTETHGKAVLPTFCQHRPHTLTARSAMWRWDMGTFKRLITRTATALIVGSVAFAAAPVGTLGHGGCCRPAPVGTVAQPSGGPLGVSVREPLGHNGCC